MSMGTSDLRIGTSGWNYPSGRGTWNGIFYPPSRGRAKGFDELSFYAEHFNTVEVNSTFYGQPRAEVSRGWARADAGRLRVLGQAVSEVHASEDVQGGVRRGVPSRERVRRLLDELARPTSPTSTNSSAASTRWPRAASWARCSRSFRRASRTARPRSTTCSGCSRRSRLPGRRRTAAQQLERRARRHALAAQRVRRRLRADRRAEVPAVDRAEPAAEHATGSTTCGCTAGTPTQWWTHEKAEDRYNYLYSAAEVSEFVETVDAARRS